MYYAFLPYEKKYREWVDNGFPEVKEETKQFMRHLLDPERKRPLWRNQQEGVLRAIYSYEILGKENLLLNIVTGGGKTAVIAAIIAWLKMAHDIRSFVILNPNIIVRDRLEADFRSEKIFRDFDLLPPLKSYLVDELGLHILGEHPSGMLESGVVLGNIQQLYGRNGRPSRNLAYIMNYLPEIAVFNDEAHNTPAPEYSNILLQLGKKAKFRLDTTATPDRADGTNPDSEMIYEYGIQEALADGLIKSVVVYQPDIKTVELTYTDVDTGKKAKVEEIDWDEIDRKGISPVQWVTDTKPLKQQLQIALGRLAEQKERAAGRYKPVLFVVTVCIADARKAAGVMEKDFGLKTLLLTEEDVTDEKRKDARELGHIDNPYDAVVSVLMLREGWDVPEVSVILLLRKFSSRVYGQQVVGRGLRRIIRDNPEEREILCVVDHPKLEHGWLWKMVSAKVRDHVSINERFDLAEDLPEPEKRQELIDPSKLIEIPEIEEGEADFEDLLQEIKEVPVTEDWQKVLDGINYPRQKVEITKVKLRGVRSIHLGEDRQIEYQEAPQEQAGGGKEPEEATTEELREDLKNRVLELATELLYEHGFGSIYKGSLYDVIMEHIGKKLLQGKTAGLATQKDLDFAIYKLEAVRRVFKKPGLVASIIRYPNVANNK